MFNRPKTSEIHHYHFIENAVVAATFFKQSLPLTEVGKAFMHTNFVQPRATPLVRPFLTRTIDRFS